MNKERVVFVITVAGESLVGEISEEYCKTYHGAPTKPAYGQFDEDANRHAVTLYNVRRFVTQHIEGPPDLTGRAKVTVAFGMPPVDPFPCAVPKMKVKLSRWVHLVYCDNPELHKNFELMLDQAEKREAVMKATAAGVSVPQ